jgi:hypothetical protein
VKRSDRPDETVVRVERDADCPFSIALSHAESFLLGSRHGHPTAISVRIPLRSIGLPLRGALRRSVRVMFHLHPDETERGRAHDAIAFAWRAPSRWLPDFHGELRIRIATVRRTRVMIESSYRPPFGALGSAFDRLIGRRLARATLTDLLERVVTHLEQSYRAALAADAGAE